MAEPTPKNINNYHKNEMCKIIFKKIQHIFDSDDSPRHVAVILPTGRNNGWCEKGVYGN